MLSQLKTRKVRKNCTGLESLEARLQMAADLGFNPLVASAPLGSANESAGFVVAPGFRAEVVQTRFDDSGLLGWPDMNITNETVVRDHMDIGRYIFTTHETSTYAAVSRTDLWTSDTRIIAQRPDLERFDGIEWTPWGTILAAEEVVTSSMSDPDHSALSGLVYEIDPFPEDLSQEFVNNGASLVIGHRGASGYRPEHTLAAYSLAIDMGADFVEPDLVSTKDGVLVARHENEISGTTNVADHPEFADLRTTKLIDGVETTGWFTEDFTLAELKTLRAKERLPQVRPANMEYDGQFEVPTLQEVIDLVKAKQLETGRTIGIYPETKHPTYFDSIHLSLEEALVATLHGAGYTGPDAPIFIQSFEVSNLKDLNQKTELPLVQLLWLEGQPYDAVAAGTKLTYDQMATSAGLTEIATYADGVGPEKGYFVNTRDNNGNLTLSGQKPFVANAHKAGLEVHPYTFRAENDFLSANAQDPLANGMYDELITYLHSGIDGFFTDQPDLGVEARNAYANVQVRPAIGSLSHEGIAVSTDGTVYVVDEFSTGSIYKFVPNTYGDLSSGKLYVMTLATPTGGRVGRGGWTELPGELASIDARQVARLVTLNKAPTYNRPEDLELVDNTLYVAVTGENRVLGIDVSDPDVPFVRDFVTANTMDLATSSPVGNAFISPDNLAADSQGRIIISEDPGTVTEGNDVWVAVDINDDGVADQVGRLASLTTLGAEPTGIYVTPTEPHALYVNIQHSASENDQLVRIVPIDHSLLPFNPLTVSAKLGPKGGDRELTTPFDLVEGWTQTVISNGKDTPVLFERNLDMIALNLTGPDAGRYLFTAHEVARANNESPSEEAAGVSRLDLTTGEVVVISQRADFEAFDGMTWTPWGTVITGEERVRQSYQDPNFPVADPSNPDAPTEAVSGMFYEIINPLGDPNDADPAKRPYTVVRPAVGSLAHEGMQFDAAGNLYVVHEFQDGGIYKFVPDVPNTPNALASGQLYVLRVLNDGLGLNDDGSFQGNSERLGVAEWVALDRAAVQTDAHSAAIAVGATRYWRPEDIEIVRGPNGKETMYVAVTGRGGTLGNSGLRQLDGPRVLSIGLGDDTWVRNFVTADTINAATGRRVGMELHNADNLASDTDGTIYIIEDNGAGDIWAARDANHDGRADLLGPWASLSTLGAEPTGLYFNPLVPGEAFVNVQHPDSGWEATVRLRRTEIMPMAGDANLDGLFDSRDLVAVLQAGKYRTGMIATWADGDWNCDGVFNETDFVFALANSRYELPQMAVAITESLFQELSSSTGPDDANSDEDNIVRDLTMLDLF